LSGFSSSLSSKSIPNKDEERRRRRRRGGD